MTPTSSDPAPKLNYWILDLQFVRLAISQETPSVEKNLKINGQLWKKLSGGNDDHICKRNYDKVDTTFQVMGNNRLTYDTADVLEHRLAFSSSVQFKSKETIEDMIEEGEDQRLIDAYKIRYDSLRDKCLTEEWMNATVYLMLQHYVNKSVPVKKQEFDQDDDDDVNSMSIRRLILLKFDFDKDSVMSIKEVNDVLDKFQKSKVETELKNLNTLKKKHVDKNNYAKYFQKYCYYGISLKKSE